MTPPPTRPVAERLADHAGELTTAERRVADAILSDPEALAFGTVADLAERASVSGGSVMRLAAKLGYVGYSALQDDVRAELSARLGSATQRIRRPVTGDLIDRSLSAELANVSGTLEHADRPAIGRAVNLLADTKSPVLVLAGDAAAGIGELVAANLGMLRDGVTVLTGNAVRVTTALALAGPRPTVLVLDLRRSDRWVAHTAARARRADARIVALTDSPLSRIGQGAAVHLTVTAVGIGPFDSYVGMLALANTLVAAVAAKLRHPATQRLDRIEAAWADAEALTDE